MAGVKDFAKLHYLKDAWEVANLNTWVDACVTAINNKNIQPVVFSGNTCSKKISDLSACIWRERFLSCPVANQVNSAYCVTTRALRGVSIVG